MGVGINWYQLAASKQKYVMKWGSSRQCSVYLKVSNGSASIACQIVALHAFLLRACCGVLQRRRVKPGVGFVTDLP